MCMIVYISIIYHKYIRTLQVEESIREALTLADIEEQNRQYHTEEDPRDVPDLFVRLKLYNYIAIEYGAVSLCQLQFKDLFFTLGQF